VKYLANNISFALQMYYLKYDTIMITIFLNFYILILIFNLFKLYLDILS